MCVIFAIIFLIFPLTKYKSDLFYTFLSEVSWESINHVCIMHTETSSIL